MAAQLFKDPYLFDFLGTADPRREAEVEQSLMDHIQIFLSSSALVSPLLDGKCGSKSAVRMTVDAAPA